MHKETVGSAEVCLIERIGSMVCPRVYARDDHGYSMELLQPYEEPDSLRRAQILLRDHVWSRPVAPSINWRDRFWERFLFYPYDWVTESAEYLTHGDPTAANVMQRENGELVLIDPKPRGNGIPGYPSVDLGKMMQSALGWERMLDPSYPVMEFDSGWIDDLPYPYGDLPRRIAFWCAVHMLRIKQREGHSRVGAWASDHADRLLAMVGE